MSDVEMILQKLRLLDLEDTKRLNEAVREHLEELEDIAAYDAVKARPEKSELLELVINRYSKSLELE